MRACVCVRARARMRVCVYKETAGSSPFAAASDRRSGRSEAARVAMGISRELKSESHLVWRVFFDSDHKRGLRLLRAAAETPRSPERTPAPAARSRGRPPAKCSIHAQGTKWIALRLDRPRKWQSIRDQVQKKLGTIEGWTLLPYDSEGVASDDDDSGAAGSTLAPASTPLGWPPTTTTKRPAPASSQAQVAASAAQAAVAASAAGRMPQRSLALKMAKIIGADAPKKKCRWSLDGVVLGKGSFGEVRRCQHPVEGEVAVKVFTGGPDFSHLDALRDDLRAGGDREGGAKRHKPMSAAKC